MEELLTVKESSRRLACSEAFIRKLIFRGKIPFVKVGRCTRLRASDLDAMILSGLNLGLASNKTKGLSR